MSDHAWSQDHVAAYVAGGLTAAEAERLDRHAGECAECAAALCQARAFDQSLTHLFAPERPGALLEERVLRALRTNTILSGKKRTWRWKVGASAAAAVLLAGFGAGAGTLMDRGALVFPGEQGQSLARLDDRAALAASRKGMMADGRGIEADASRSGPLSFRSYGQAPAEGPADRSLAASRLALGDGEVNGSVLARDQLTDAPSPGPAPTPPPISAPGASSPPLAGAGAPVAEGKGDSVGRTNYFRLDDVSGGPVASFGGDGRRVVAPSGKDGKATQSAQSAAVPPPEQPPADAPPVVQAPKPAAPEATATARKVIRTGDIEFEIESFDAAAASVTKIVTGIKGAFIATVNSEKLPNGKVRGSMVVRVPPEALDSLVLDLRRDLGKGGELKGLRVASQDVTKHYTDLESRLKAARTMETRLLEIIKSGKGEIKQLLEAEKELGNWRTKIEELEGEVRYLANQVALSTLTVTLVEKSITSAVGLVESERVQARVEVEDIDKAQRDLLSAVQDAKGRILKSEMKQHAAGQRHAQLQVEVPPEAAGALRDRIKQLGHVVRLETDRVQRTEGTGTAPRDAKAKPGPTEFQVSLYNLANIAPRETATLRLAAADVPAAYRALQKTVLEAKARVINGQLNEQDRQNVSAQLDFDALRSQEPALLAALSEAGETLSRTVARAPESENVTDAKVAYRVTFVSAASLPPRETTTLTLEVEQVDQALTVLGAQIKEVGGRVVQSQFSQDAGGRLRAHVTYDVPASAAGGLLERFKGLGQARVQMVSHNRQAPDGKLATARFDVTLTSELLVPADEGLWPQVRKGLSYSLRGLTLSVSWLIFAVLVLLPWALLLGGVAWLFRRLFRSTDGASAAVAAAAPSSGPATSA